MLNCWVEKCKRRKWQRPGKKWRCAVPVCVRAREGMKWNTRNYLVAVQMHIVWLQEASTNHLEIERECGWCECASALCGERQKENGKSGNCQSRKIRRGNAFTQLPMPTRQSTNPIAPFYRIRVAGCTAVVSVVNAVLLANGCCD